MALSLVFQGIKYFVLVASLAPFPSLAYFKPLIIAPIGSEELVAPML